MKNYSNSFVQGYQEIAGRLYVGAGSLLALGPASGDASALTGQLTPAGGQSQQGIGDKLDLYNGQYGIGIQASRVVCYMAGGGFAIRQYNVGGGARSVGTDAVVLFANGNVTAIGTISAPTITATTAMNAPLLNATGVTQQVSVLGANPNAVFPTAVGSRMGGDVLRWKTPSAIEVSAASDNTGWTTAGAPTAATVANALCGRYDLAGLYLTAALPALRLTFTGFNATYISHVLVGCMYGPGSATRVIVESSADGVAWTSRGDTATSMDLSHKWTVLPIADVGQDQWRITFLMTGFVANVPIASIQAISTRPGNQGPNGTNDYPYYWDNARNLYAYNKLYGANRARFGFNANTTSPTPLTTSAAEFELTAQSMVTIGEGVAADGNPAITMYRTASGLRAGRAVRNRLTSSNGPLVWEYGAGNVNYGSETYTEGARLDMSGNLSAAAQLAAYFGNTAQMRIVGSVASGAPTAGTFAVGDVSLSRSDGKLYTCIVAGTPGTWVLGASNPASAATKTLTVVNLPAPQALDYRYTATLDRAGYLVRPPNSSPGFATMPGGVIGRLSYAAASITGDLDVKLKLAMADWTPAVIGVLAAKTNSADSVTGWSWNIFLNTNGTITIQVIPDGNFNSRQNFVSSAAVPFADGATGWVRVQYDGDTGLGGSSATFYTSTDGVAWTQLGIQRTGTVMFPYDNAAVPYTVGNYTGGTTQSLAGDVLSIQILNGLGGANVVPADPSSWTATLATLYPPTAPVAGSTLRLALTQDATGSRTVTWPSNVKWPGGTAPTLTATANATDLLQLECLDGTNWLGRVEALDVR